jgi:hypothetical protein
LHPASEPENRDHLDVREESYTRIHRIGIGAVNLVTNRHCNCSAECLVPVTIWTVTPRFAGTGREQTGDENLVTSEAETTPDSNEIYLSSWVSPLHSVVPGIYHRKALMDDRIHNSSDAYHAMKFGAESPFVVSGTASNDWSVPVTTTRATYGFRHLSDEKPGRSKR